MDTTIEIAKKVINTLIELITIAPIDLIVIFILFGFFLGIGFQYGKKHIIALILSLYISSFIYLFFPYTDRIIQLETSGFVLAIIITGISFVAFIVLYITLNRVVNISFPSSSSKRWLEASIVSIFSTTLILALSYHIFPIENIYDFSAPIDSFFESDEYFFWWLVVPLIALFFVGKKRREED